jgi:hypothetical protein
VPLPVVAMMKQDYLVLLVHDSFVAYSGLGDLITELMKDPYHARMKAEVGVDVDLTFLEQELPEQNLPGDEEHPEIFDTIDARLSDPEYRGYTQRLNDFLDRQPDDWHRRFEV